MNVCVWESSIFSSFQTAINECTLREGATPCQNGGTCEDSVGTYYCHCAEGYAGTNCTERGEQHDNFMAEIGW